MTSPTNAHRFTSAGHRTRRGRVGVPAIQEQLGRKLEQHLEAQDVLVVDRVEKPGED